MSEKTCLLFDELGLSPSGKTCVWQVKNVQWNATLGTIKWYAPWRRYVFFPQTGTLYDAGCLAEIATFIEQQMEERL